MFRWVQFSRGWAKFILYRTGKIATGTLTSTFATAHFARYASNYFHRSGIPTMHFQASLPRLPIPKLKDTQQRYLEAQKPFLTAKEHKRCTEVTASFFANEGKVLQAKLIEKDITNSHTSYIAEDWLDMYLMNRDSIITKNSYIGMKDDPRAADQLLRATKLIHASLKFKKSLDDSILESDVYHINRSKSDTKIFRQVTKLLPSKISSYGAYVFKAFPLDMSQYGRLFNTTRIPKCEKDELFTDANAKHILILKNGHYFVFDVFKCDGTILTMDEIYKNLKFIAESSRSKAVYSLGVLTVQKRNTWALIRRSLEIDPSNATSLKLIDGALFALCLEEKECLNEKDSNKMFLYGNPDNCWFDKSFQLILSKNGRAAIHHEHSWTNGGTIMRYLNEIYTESRANRYEKAEQLYSHGVQKLTFNLSPTLISSIEIAKENHHLSTLGISENFGKTEELGKNFFKLHKVSPDAMFQLAMQMAHYRLTGNVATAHEACSTAMFKHGRTKYIRPASIATVACSEAFEKAHPAGVEELVDLLKKQSNYHKKLIREASIGQGFDRHLFALKTTADKLGKSVDFFNDPTFLNINDLILYTSTTYSPNAILAGFSPIFRNGFGIAYLIEDESLRFNINSYPESPNGSDFVQLLLDSLHDTGAILSGKNIKLL